MGKVELSYFASTRTGSEYEHGIGFDEQARIGLRLVTWSSAMIG